MKMKQGIILNKYKIKTLIYPMKYPDKKCIWSYGQKLSTCWHEMKGKE